MTTNPSTRHERAHARHALVAAALAVTLTLLGASAARASTPIQVPPSPRVSAYSPRALVAAADADLAAGHPGAAIVALERARMLAPRSAVVASGLAHAREAAHLPPVSTGRVLRLLQSLSGREWSRVALGGLALAAAGVILLSWGVSGGASRRRRRAAGLVSAGLAVCALGVFATWKVTPSRGDAVVVAADGTARIAPFSQAEPAFSVPEGAPVAIERAHGDYLLVEASGEGRGWLPRGSVETILPLAPHRP